MSWWKRKKCPLCKTVLKKKHKTGKLCMETAEGPLELEICMGCSTVLDHSSQILESKYGNTEGNLDYDYEGQRDISDN